MKVLLLGGTGYLGGNVAQGLAEAGIEVVCATRAALPTESPLARYADVVRYSQVGDMEPVMRNQALDWVVNCAGAYGSRPCDYLGIMRANAGFPSEVLCLAVSCGIPNFMTMGTGLPSALGLYSKSKSLLSELGMFMSKTHSLNFADLKLEMFYGGAGEPDSRFLRSCKLKLLKGEPLLLTSGEQRRDIVRVEDVVSLICAVASSGYVSGYRALPVGSGECLPIREIVDFMKEHVGSESELVFGAVESREGEPDTCADVSWYREIGFEPKFDLNSGLAEYCLPDKIARGGVV